MSKTNATARTVVSINREIAKGNYSGHPNNGGAIVAMDKAAWGQLWTQHTARQFPPLKTPRVNFSKYMVVAVFRGSVSSGGHDIEIQQIYDDGTNLVVEVKADNPVGGGASAGFSQSFHMVATDKNSKPVKVDWK